MKHFSKELTLLVSTSKHAFLLECTDPGPQNSCKNCDGLGYHAVFIATEGPYQTPSAPYRGDGKVSKWHDNKWWVGNTVCFTCPNCKGLGYIEVKAPVYSQRPFDDSRLVRSMSVRKDLE